MIWLWLLAFAAIIITGLRPKAIAALFVGMVFALCTAFVLGLLIVMDEAAQQRHKAAKHVPSSWTASLQQTGRRAKP